MAERWDNPMKPLPGPLRSEPMYGGRYWWQFAYIGWRGYVGWYSSLDLSPGAAFWSMDGRRYSYHGEGR